MLEYKPIKKREAHMMRRSGIIRKLFYLITGIVFLREWYIKRAVTKIYLDKKYFDEILDAGSGFGQYCYFCKKRFPEAEILGIDINQNYVDDCNYFVKKAGIKRVRFEKSDLTTIDYSDKFDLILSIDVLEHIKDDIRLLSLFNRAVKPEGFVIISTPTL